MPMVTKKGLERLAKQKALLELRRNPKKGKPQPFKPRLMEYSIEICTETEEGSEELARDVPYKINAKDSLHAVLEALADFEGKLKPRESIHYIHVSPGKWIEREGIGKQ